MNNNIDFIEKGLNILEENLKEREQLQLRKQIGKIIFEMGYHSAGREIENNRNAKENARRFINMYYNNKMSNRYNIETKETLEVSEEYKNKLIKFKDMFMILVDKLDEQTLLQTEYLQLKQELINFTWKVSEIYKEMNLKLDELEDRKEVINIINEYDSKIKHLEGLKNIAEDKLDTFILRRL